MWQPVRMEHEHRDDGRRRWSLLAWVCAVAVLGGCADASADDDGPPAPIVRVASGPDQETELLAHIAGALLAQGGFAPELETFADRRDTRQALELGAIDVAIGYSGEAWLETMGRADPPGDPERSFREVREHDAQAGNIWLSPRFADGPATPPANATFAFVVQGPPAVDADLTSMSQLASRLSAQPEALVCVDREFASRPDGLPAVLSAYSVRSDRPFLAADPDAAVLGVLAGDCLAGLTTATDGDVWRAGLRPLHDDLRVFPAFVPAIVVRDDVLDRHPTVRSALSPLGAHMTTPSLGQWNARVRAGEPVADVAADVAQELLRASGRDVDDDVGP